jgi:hypothetical protein
VVKKSQPFSKKLLAWLIKTTRRKKMQYAKKMPAWYISKSGADGKALPSTWGVGFRGASVCLRRGFMEGDMGVQVPL